MPFNSHYLNATIFPHVFSRFPQDVKSKYRRRYKNAKRNCSIVTIAGVSTVECVDLAKDVVSSKLKAYGYKSLFAIASGPIIQIVSIPFYVFSYGSRFRRFAVATSELGARISTGEMTVINWAWLGLDLILFGEPVSITDDLQLMIFHNETIGEIGKIVESVGVTDD